MRDISADQVRENFAKITDRNGSPQGIGNLALFLASDDSSFITRQIIFCDGGMKM